MLWKWYRRFWRGRIDFVADEVGKAAAAEVEVQGCEVDEEGGYEDEGKAEGDARHDSDGEVRSKKERGEAQGTKRCDK